jgi:hypothetical protein
LHEVDSKHGPLKTIGSGTRKVIPKAWPTRLLLNGLPPMQILSNGTNTAYNAPEGRGIHSEDELTMKNSIKSAIQNIAAFGDTDIFPYTFEQHVFRDRPELFQKALEELHKDFETHLAQYSPDNINTLTPVGYTGFRWATQIDPAWNAYYLALVIEMGEVIEKARIPVNENAVFSYRFVPPMVEGRIFDDKVNWYAFMQAALEAAKKFPFVIICDISDFYSRVYHHRVENALKWLKAKPDVVKRIVSLLGEFSGNVSYGLPVGGPASRLLAELVLNTVDKQLRSEGVCFCRFVDDYRLFCSTKEEAYERLILISEKLFNEGLSLQKNKTRILTAKEFTDEVSLLLKAHQAEEDNLTEEDRLLRISIRFDPYSDTRVDDYEELKEQVAEVDIVGILTRELEKTRIDGAITKQALLALRVLDSEPRKQILAMVLQPENMQTLAPVFPRLMMVLRSIYVDLDEETQDMVDEALMKLVNMDSYIVKVDLNLAYLIQVLRRRSTQPKETLFVKLFKVRPSPLVRREIILAMADWGHNHWLTDLKKHFSGLSKWERRAYIVASYFLTDEGKHWRKKSDSSFEPTEKVIRKWFADRFQKNQSVPQ